MGDITSRRRRARHQRGRARRAGGGGALVPANELQHYVDLRSITSGNGTFTVQHDHYDVLPAHLVEKAKQSLPKS